MIKHTEKISTITGENETIVDKLGLRRAHIPTAIKK